MTGVVSVTPGAIVTLPGHGEYIVRGFITATKVQLESVSTAEIRPALLTDLDSSAPRSEANAMDLAEADEPGWAEAKRKYGYVQELLSAGGGAEAALRIATKAGAGVSTLYKWKADYQKGQLTAIAQLRAVLEEHGYGEKLRNESIRLITGEFTALSDQVIARAKARSPKSGRALFVLDQYGYDKVPASALKQIFQTLSHAEVILTFNVDALINYLSPKNLLDFERKTGIHGTVAAADLDKALRGPAWRARIQANLYRRITEDSGAQYFTPFFIRPQSGHGDFWLLHLSQHWKARDVMTTAHWQHHNHFIHYGKAGFDMLSTGYAARIDDAEQMQAGFEFDDAAANASQQEMRVQIPRALHELPEGITFERFFLGRVNTTPATRGMIESALLQLVRDKAIEIVGSEGDVRNVRSAVQGHHILRLPKQKSLTFGGI